MRSGVPNRHRIKLDAVKRYYALCEDIKHC